jgi:MFS family permease
MLDLGLGLACGSIGCYLFLDKYIAKRAGVGSAKPEHRLPILFVGSFVMPIGLFLYGWTVNPKIHWMVPLVGLWLIGLGLTVTVVPVRTYLADVFAEYAASAIAAGVFFQTVAGAVLPLAGPPVYAKLGYAWGNSLLGFIALGFAPLPIFFYRYGRALRVRFPVLD